MFLDLLFLIPNNKTHFFSLSITLLNFILFSMFSFCLPFIQIVLLIPKNDIVGICYILTSPSIFLCQRGQCLWWWLVVAIWFYFNKFFFITMILTKNNFPIFLRFRNWGDKKTGPFKTARAHLIDFFDHVK